MGLKRNRIPTWTNLVLAYLRKVDDFKTITEIADATKITKKRVMSGLWNLHNHRCVDLIQTQGKTYWYALPEEEDTRSKVFMERVEEVNPRKKKLKVQKK